MNHVFLMSSMGQGLIALFVIAAIALVILYFTVWKPKKTGSSTNLNDGIDWRSVPAGVVPTDDKVRQVTKLGISILSASGKPDSLLDDADRAYLYEKDRATTEGGYTQFPEPSVIDIRFPKDGCTPSPEQHIPAFLIKAGRDYEAGEYDQHYSIKYDPPQERNGVLLYSEPDDCAVIYCAELVTGLSTAGSNPPRDSAICCDGVFYEGACNFFQHCFIAHNDGEYYAETSLAGHTHPLAYRPLAAPVQSARRLVDAGVPKLTQARMGLSDRPTILPVK